MAPQDLTSVPLPCSHVLPQCCCCGCRIRHHQSCELPCTAPEVTQLKSQASLEKAKAWVKELQRQANPNIVICLVGNKVSSRMLSVMTQLTSSSTWSLTRRQRLLHQRNRPRARRPMPKPTPRRMRRPHRLPLQLWPTTKTRGRC